MEKKNEKPSSYRLPLIYKDYFGHILTVIGGEGVNCLC